MENKLKRILRKIASFPHVLDGDAKVSFSQFGEDIVLLSLLGRLKIDEITYLDIGANDPVRINNTYNFYLRGYTGVLVEPNEYLCEKLRKKRPKDVVLNCGIGTDNENAVDYYMFRGDMGVYNTFSKEVAESTQKEGIPIEKVIKVALKSINDVIAEQFNKPLTLLSIDVEGLDEAILRKIDYTKHKPFTICVETVNFSTKEELIKSNSLIDFLISQGYFIYADTHINTIFCDRNQFEKYIKAL